MLDLISCAIDLDRGRRQTADLVMNFNYLAKRILGRSTCVRGSHTKIGATGRILNPRESSNYIRIGNRSVINGELCVLPHGGNIVIGERCFIDAGTRIWSGVSIVIEDDVVIGPGCNIFDNISHPLSAIERAEHAIQIFTKGHPHAIISLGDRPIRIGRGTTIGAKCFVLRGVTIGEYSLIPHGSLVTKSFP